MGFIILKDNNPNGINVYRNFINIEMCAPEGVELTHEKFQLQNIFGPRQWLQRKPGVRPFAEQRVAAESTVYKTITCYLIFSKSLYCFGKAPKKLMDSVFGFVIGERL